MHMKIGSTRLGYAMNTSTCHGYRKVKDFTRKKGIRNTTILDSIPILKNLGITVFNPCTCAKCAKKNCP